MEEGDRQVGELQFPHLLRHPCVLLNDLHDLLMIATGNTSWVVIK